VNLLNGGTATFSLNGTVTATPTSGTLANTATVTAPVGTADPAPGNNSAIDTDTIVVELPALNLLDNFNRNDANNLGGNWSQSNNNAIRVNNQQAQNNNNNNNTTSQAIWNAPTSGFAATQGAAFTFANTPVNGSSLFLKATGSNTTAPANFIRVRYETANGGQVVIATTTNGNANTPTYTLPAAFANGNTLTAIAYADGTLWVWKTAGTTVTFLGSVQLPSNALWTTGGGRIGIQLPNNARVDDFRGGMIAPPLPALALLDNFNRNSLGTSWSQTGTALRINNNRMDANNAGSAIWNSTNIFGATQGAAFTFASNTVNNSALILKATGTNNAAPTSFIRVLYNNGQVTVATTTNGSSFTSAGTLAASFANGNSLYAVANADGSVFVWKTDGNTITFLGSVAIPTTGIGAWTQGTGGGRIGIQLPNNAQIDNFAGGLVIAPVPLPALALVDNFDRTNANTLGANWSSSGSIYRINNNQASVQQNGNNGFAIWNAPIFGARQGAAFTFANAISNSQSSNIILKASGGTTTATPTNYIAVSYQSGIVQVSTAVNGTLTTRGSFAAYFTSGDKISAVAYGDGTVNVYRTTGTTTTFIGSVQLPNVTAWTTDGGRIGIRLPLSGRIDNFLGADVP
jgi:hypothetical protein